MPDQAKPAVDQQRTANPLRDALESIGKMSNNVRFSENATAREMDQLRAEVARLRDALDAVVGYVTNLEPSRDEALAMAEAALATPAPPDPKDARIAQLEEALKAYYALDEQRANCEECGDTPEIAAEACETCMPFADDARLKMRATLSRSPGEWLEERLREAQIEVLEGLPCESAGTHAPECKDIDEEMFGLCPRCKALAALKGGK